MAQTSKILIHHAPRSQVMQRLIFQHLRPCIKADVNVESQHRKLQHSEHTNQAQVASNSRNCSARVGAVQLAARVTWSVKRREVNTEGVPNRFTGSSLFWMWRSLLLARQYNNTADQAHQAHQAPMVLWSLDSGYERHENLA